MQHWLRVVALVMAALVPALIVAQSKRAAPAADPSLQKAIESRRSARVAKDIAVWEQLTHDDAVEIHSNGRVHTKAEEIAEIKASAGEPSQDTDEKIMVYGSTVVRTLLRNTSRGAFRVANVWVKNDSGNWQSILTQQTAVAK